MTTSRLLRDCPAVLFIVYTPGPGAEERGYAKWLREIDNPFFNAIPGVHHYANWKVEEARIGAPLDYTHFDLQGLAAANDLERVWFNPDLDVFRREWVRLWGYSAGAPGPVQASAYLMRPVHQRAVPARSFARVSGGIGPAPEDHDHAWRFTETIRKHYAMGTSGDAWRLPVAEDNPLGLDWLVLDYGGDTASLAAAEPPAGATLSFNARLLAAP